MKVEKTALDGVLKVTPPTNFKDYRGDYVELYNKDLYRKAGVEQEFIQDDISVSKKNVLRGIHGDAVTWKLVCCLFGKFYLVVLNNDSESTQYGKWVSFNLSAEKYEQILIPPKFGNGHLILSEKAIFHYKQSTYYDPDSQFIIKWDDRRFNIYWPIKNPILSRRDMYNDTSDK